LLAPFPKQPPRMGAGASACGAESNAIFAQMMEKWDALAQQPEFANELPRPDNYEELLMMGCPREPPAREFFFAMKEHFHGLVGKQTATVIEIPLDENQTPGQANSLQAAFKGRPITAKKRPNKKRQQMKERALRENSRPMAAFN